MERFWFLELAQGCSPSDVCCGQSASLQMAEELTKHSVCADPAHVRQALPCVSHTVSPTGMQESIFTKTPGECV
jgi:hypothetical protein